MAHETCGQTKDGKFSNLIEVLWTVSCEIYYPPPGHIGCADGGMNQLYLMNADDGTSANQVETPAKSTGMEQVEQSRLSIAQL